jgi:metallo-beta-lactamase class B
MRRRSLCLALLLCLCAVIVQAQGPAVSKPPFSAKDAEIGKQLAAKSLEIRAQITNPSGAAEPFKMIGNLYFVGEQNGEVYVLTSPQGHIMFGAGYAQGAEGVEKNIAAMGLKLSDIKVILINHNHADQSGAAAYFKQKTGAQVMAGFGEIPFLEHGGAMPAGTQVPNLPPAPRPQGQAAPAGGGGPGGYPPVKVDRALYDGDVVKVGPLSVTAYLIPGHSPSSTTFVYTVRDGNRDYRTVQFCCWEYPEDLSRSAYINEASVRHTFETFRKMMPIDIYLELGRYAWGGVVNQPGNLTFAERIEKVKADPKLFVNRDIFNQWSAAREVEFEQKLAKLKK